MTPKHAYIIHGWSLTLIWKIERKLTPFYQKKTIDRLDQDFVSFYNLNWKDYNVTFLHFLHNQNTKPIPTFLNQRCVTAGALKSRRISIRFSRKKKSRCPCQAVIRIASSNLSGEIPSLCSNNKRRGDAGATVWFSNRGEGRK